mmetsp:Transcript_76933/g.154321  ORF Transcript_76933/g.154321 Transcript_76933/m.154321 type:complete len:299 (-) Transcript_76933:73-969(-)
MWSSHSSYGYSAFGGGYFDDGGVDRSSFAEKSEAAQRREDAAKAKFDDIVAETETGGEKATIELLKPSTHLTGPCWSAFGKHVRSSPGWSTKRRVATEAEKRASGETRQAKCYFVDVAYTPTKQKKKKTATKVVASVSSSSDMSQEGPAKKQKTLVCDLVSPAAAAKPTAASTKSSPALACASEHPMFSSNWLVDDGEKENSKSKQVLDLKDGVVKLGAYGDRKVLQVGSAKLSSSKPDSKVVFTVNQGGCAECFRDEVFELSLELGGQRLNVHSYVECQCDGEYNECEESNWVAVWK